MPDAGPSYPPQAATQEVQRVQEIDAGAPEEETYIGDPSEHDLTGRASWYGKRFHGRKTACGEPFDMYEFTAAHKTLPFHTVVRITDIVTRKSVVVRINDRGPYKRGRVIDLSKAAARDIGMLKRGTAKVSLTILGWGSGERCL